MNRELTSQRRGPVDQPAKAVVIFLHGYGADGADLLGLADPMGTHLPGTAFFAPDAPEPSQANPMGYQWFSIPWMDGSTPENAAAGQARSAADIDAFIDQVIADEGVAASQVALVGFSQGTMMSLHVAPRRAEPLGAVVGFSGRLLQPEALADETVSRPPVLLIHGDMDEVVPPSSLPEAEAALQAAGFDVTSHVSKGIGHGIAPDGLSLAVSFLRDKLGLG